MRQIIEVYILKVYRRFKCSIKVFGLTSPGDVLRADPGTHEEYEKQYLYRCMLCNACTG